jgi:hypothetical protein
MLTMPPQEINATRGDERRVDKNRLACSTGGKRHTSGGRTRISLLAVKTGLTVID